jgi:hypothetical protein
MSALNPYASFLAKSDPITVIESTPGILAGIVGSLDSDILNREPAPGKWSIRDILCHLADTEIAFGFRLRQSLAEPHHVIQPFDQERWAAPYPNLTAHDALDAFSASRKWNVRLIRSLAKDAFSRELVHPERGSMTFQTLVETMGGHDLNHLSQIERLAATRS